MAKSYRSRLEEAGEMAVFLKYSKTFGRIVAMGLWGFKDDGAVVEIYKKETGDEDFGRIPQIGYPRVPDNQDPIEWIFERLANSLRNLKEQNLEKDRVIGELRQQNEQITNGHQQALARGLIKLLEVCDA